MCQAKVKKLERVCLYITTLGTGGAERQIVTLAKELKANGIEVRVLCNRLEGENGHFLPFLTHAGIPAETFTKQENLDLGLAFIQKKPECYATLAELPLDHATVLSLAGRLLRMSPDILHCYLDTGNCLGGCAALCAGVPGVLLSTRNTIPANIGYPELAAWTQPVYKFLLQHSHVKLEANSSAGARDYANWLDTSLEHIAVTPNGLDVAEFQRQQTMSGVAMRKSLGVPTDAKIVVWIGRNKEQKRPLDMLAVAAHVCQKLPQTKFIVLGWGMDSAEPFVEPIRELGLDNGVIFLGCREDAFSLISAADAVLLTSRIEGFPNVILEAMYAGLPVVTTKVGGISDLVHHGIHGFLHQVGDIEGMAHSLLRVLCNPHIAKKMGGASRKRVEDEFTAQQLGKNVQTLYAELLAKPSM